MVVGQTIPKTMRYIKKSKLDQSFTILFDTREQKPWTLPPQYPMKRVHLKVGDYTIKGYESIIAIEKKSGLAELFTDLSVSYRPTFKRFLRKLAQFPIKAIVVQDSLNSGTLHRCLTELNRKSKGKMQMTEETLYYWVSEITLKYGIPILFVDKAILLNILPRIFEAAFRKAQEMKQ